MASNTMMSMRDIFDYCRTHNLKSVAQGMVELPPPIKLRQMIAETALSSNVHTYRNRWGEPDFRQALVAHLARREGISFLTPDHLLASAGVTGTIIATLVLARNRGVKKTALLEPFYTYHARQVEAIFGESPAAVATDRATFAPDWEDLRRQLDDGLGLLIVTNPGNPTGRIAPREEILRLIEETRRTGCFLVFDEIYCDMVWGDGASHATGIVDAPPEHVVVARGFSKVLGLQSSRIGFAVAHPKTVAGMMAQSDPVFISVSWVQHALARYLSQEGEDFDRHARELNALLRANFDRLAHAFETSLGWRRVQGTAGAMYALFHHDEETDDAALQKGLAKGVGVAPATMFYRAEAGPRIGMIRIHLGMLPDETEEITQILLK